MTSRITKIQFILRTKLMSLLRHSWNLWNEPIDETSPIDHLQGVPKTWEFSDEFDIVFFMN